MKHSINSLVPNKDAELALLWELIDFDELFRMTGSLGVTGFWGKETYLEPF